MAKHALARKKRRGRGFLRFFILLLLALAAIFISAMAVKRMKEGKPEGNNDGDNQKLTDTELHQKEELIRQRQASVLSNSRSLSDGYYYNEALSLMFELNPKEINREIMAEMLSIQSKKCGIQLYNGPLYHIFFHSLIIYTDLAFDNKGHPASGYNMWMTTRDEFVRMLPLLKDRGYVLYDIEDYIIRNADGTISKRDVYLPEGKMPLVISIDDVCYYDYMKPDGFANRLVVNDNNEVVTEVIEPDGTVSLTYDGDVMPILDQFVKQYPEFSFRGAKGVVAVTGYQGALGYRITDLEGEELEKARDEVSRIANLMRENGWKFACHSYTHNGYFRDGSITMEQLISDTTRWKTLIEPYVGETKIYISPFGVHFKESDERYQYIVKNGFDIYCGVSNTLKTAYYRTSMTQERFDMDGYMMFNKPEYIAKYYFNVDDVIDKSRPPLK